MKISVPSSDPSTTFIGHPRNLRLDSPKKENLCSGVLADLSVVLSPPTDDWSR